MDINKLVTDLAPVMSALFSSGITYIVTKNNNSLKLTEKEYEYIQQERIRIEKMLSNEIESLRLEKSNLIIELSTIRKELENLDSQEEECQRNLLLARYKIKLLEQKLSNLTQ